MNQLFCISEQKTRESETLEKLRINLWDEANRLRSAVLNGGKMMHYIYDASGERTLKAQTEYQGVFENGIPTDEGSTLNSYTTYPSPFITISPNNNYTNHYYAGSQRIASKPVGKANIFNVLQEDIIELDELKSRQLADAQSIADSMDLGPLNLADGPIVIITTAVYYFHPDHLGTSTLITDMFGDPYQFFLNLPFGESMAEQRRSGSFNNPYKFNGKELDAETSLYYYGARYYNPRISNWLSVDPIALWQPVQEIEHYIEGQHNGGYFNPKNMSVYGYTYQSPVIYVDPNGKQTISGFLIGKDVGLYVEYNMDFNTVKVGKSNVSIKYNIGTSNISITQGGSDERYATREFQKGIDIPSFAVNMVDFASDVKMDILLGSALTIDEGIQSLGISSETSSIITTEIINYLSNMINDVKDGKATLTYSKADNIYIKKNGKHYKYTDGYNWTVKYRNGDGTKLFLRYTDYNDKRSVEKRKKDTENYKQRLDAIRNDSVIQSKKRENGGL